MVTTLGELIARSEILAYAITVAVVTIDIANAIHRLDLVFRIKAVTVEGVIREIAGRIIAAGVSKKLWSIENVVALLD